MMAQQGIRLDQLCMYPAHSTVYHMPHHVMSNKEAWTARTFLPMELPNFMLLGERSVLLGFIRADANYGSS